MTRKKKLKNRIRARMEKSGESYSQARAALFDPKKSFELQNPLQKIGFWKDRRESGYPDPLDLVDASWNPAKRAAVVKHLKHKGRVVRRSLMSPLCLLGCGVGSDKAAHLQFFKGMNVDNRKMDWASRWQARIQASRRASEANITGSESESRELGRAFMTDGTYVWPESLIHYVEHHNVRLPQGFVDHVSSHVEQAPEGSLVLFDHGTWSDHWWKTATQDFRELSLVPPPFQTIEVVLPFPQGWYWHDQDYPGEGSDGPYRTKRDAEQAALVTLGQDKEKFGPVHQSWFRGELTLTEALGALDEEEVSVWEQKKQARFVQRYSAATVQKQLDVGSPFVPSVRGVLEGSIAQVATAASALFLVEVAPKPGEWEICVEQKGDTLRCTLVFQDPERYPHFLRSLTEECLLFLEALSEARLLET